MIFFNKNIEENKKGDESLEIHHLFTEITVNYFFLYFLVLGSSIANLIAVMTVKPIAVIQKVFITGCGTGEAHTAPMQSLLGFINPPDIWYKKIDKFIQQAVPLFIYFSFYKNFPIFVIFTTLVSMFALNMQYKLIFLNMQGNFYES